MSLNLQLGGKLIYRKDPTLVHLTAAVRITDYATACRKKTNQLSGDILRKHGFVLLNLESKKTNLRIHRSL